MIKNGETYLITTDEWFVAPDGDYYKAVWGKVSCKEVKKEMGFKLIRSSNWFLEVGEGEGSILIAGCQIHYAIKINKKPELIKGSYVDKDTGRTLVHNKIYIPPIKTRTSKKICEHYQLNFRRGICRRSKITTSTPIPHVITNCGGDIEKCKSRDK